MYGTILTFIKFNNFGTWRLNGPMCLFHSFCCTTQYIFELLHVYEPGFNTDKYGNNKTIQYRRLILWGLIFRGFLSMVIYEVLYV